MEKKCINYQIVNAILSAIAVIIGFVLSFIGIMQTVKARKDIAKTNIEEQRIQEVNNLVRFLINRRYLVCFAELDDKGLYSGGSTSPYYYNLFEIGNLARYGDTGYGSKEDEDVDMIHRSNIQFDDVLVVFDKEAIPFFDVKQFIDNVTIPKEIADELMSFSDIYHDEKDLPLARYDNTRIVVIKPHVDKIKIPKFKKVEFVQCDACKSWLNLKNHANKVMTAIDTWYLKHDIKDWNCRIDYKYGVDFLKLMGIK